MDTKLVICVLLIASLMLTGCQVKYVCSDGSVVSKQKACPIEGLKSYETVLIQGVLDDICEGYIHHDENLVISTIDPKIVFDNDGVAEIILDKVLYPAGPYQSVELCKMNITKTSFNEDMDKATATLRFDFRGNKDSGEIDELNGKSITYFFTKVDGEWKTTTYGSS